ncbi:MAG: hypothetical protein RLZZ127_978, partial [Planctomycetota bacterium]
MDPQSRASDAVAEAFAERHGAACARVRITRAQTARIAVMAGLLLLAGWLAGLSPALAIAAAMGGLCLLLIALRSVAILRTLVRDPSLRPGTALPDDRLPGYAVLAPLYREPEVASHLVTALERLDYPRDRLDVQILVEDDDAITRNALAACALPAWMRVTVVPPGSPRTKPRALDHGLATARGDLLTIYDAEDQPEPDQLRLAANAFAELPAAVACLQSRLDHVNARQSLAAGWSCVEYLVWFRVVMPGLAGLGMPLPLGGTSNHFRTAVLRELGGWDPYNVTEDCDLGLRLRRAGYASRMLASTTWEEAVATVPAWIRQRSRWHKGFIQTWLVHARPGGPLRPLGPVDGLWSFLLTGGPVLMLLLQPFAWVATAWWLAGGWDAGDAGDNLSLALTVAGVTGLVAQMLVLATGVAACLALGRPGLAPAAALAPLSWALHSIAAWRALWQMVVQPFAWEKTAHGRSRPDPRLRPWRRAAAALAACLLAGGTGYGLWAAADHRIASDRAARAEAQAEQRRQELARLAEQERRRAAEARRREDEERQRQAVELAAEQQRQRDR